jgi:hypothetical protein
MTARAREQGGKILGIARYVAQIGIHENSHVSPGGGVVVFIAGLATANPTIRPFSRNDATDTRIAAAEAALAAYRPAARPAYMLRYPVEVNTTTPTMRPNLRNGFLPNARWNHKTGSDVWTRAAMVSVGSYGNGLETIIPRDIDR